jgi:two-component system, NarL family, response regulator LiaR
MTDSKIKVLIVDDHNVVRKGLAALLSDEKYAIEVVGEAGDGEEAVQKSLQLEPDVILMDLVMPRKDGIDAILEIRKIQPKARILVLTSYAEDQKVADALKAGAYGFLMKDTSPDELVQTIRSVYANRLTLPQELSHVFLGSKTKNEEPPSLVAELTERELDVLRCIARGMSNKQVAQQLSISTTTVRSHVSSLMRKLALENRTQLALYAREHSLI